VWEWLVSGAMWEALWDEGNIGYWFRRIVLALILIFCVWAIYMQWFR
jgi:hypothetical protein